MSVLKKWLKRLGLIFALPVLIMLVAGIWLGAKVLFYSQEDDEARLAGKQEYLAQVSASIGVNAASQDEARPNIIFILYDDLGYGDIGTFGAEAIETPNIDALADSGIKLTNFYSPSPVCTPARAGFMTGRMPPRAGLSQVIMPSSSALSAFTKISDNNVRLPAEEITIADMLSAAGYDTAMVGKWHMGDFSPSLPNDMGFDTFFGALHSNDMEPFALYRDKEVEFEHPADQTQMDRLYTREAVDVINRGAQENAAPFFLYFAHNFPHVPLHVDHGHEGRSAAGLYGDVIEVLDDGVGSIVTALEETGQLENTVIVISSDNGPWWQGDPSSLRGRKGETWEGGMRVPFIIHWPAGLEGGQVNDEMAMGIDLLPTFADWLDLPLPLDRVIDGRSIATMLAQKGATPHEFLFYFAENDVLAVRSSTHKFIGVRNHVYAPMNMSFGLTQEKGPWLIDLNLDPREAYDLTLNQPDLAEEMAAVLEEKRQEMEDNPRGWINP